MTERFNVGGVMLERPFRIRRLGHFEFISNHIRDSLHFYTTLLGFRISDAHDTSHRFTPEALATIDDPKLYLTRYGSDHHALVLSSAKLKAARGRTSPPKITVSQITWQVGSLREVVEGERWFRRDGLKILKSGRDVPGHNWHSYTPDPDGHPNEIYYGMEQIGWEGRSRPYAMHRGFYEPPPLPQISEYQEIEAAMAQGIDIGSGFRDRERLPFDHVVDGIHMPRPFRVTGIGPVRLFVSDLEAALRFYSERLGLQMTEEVSWQGHRCVFLRANTEHHSMALYPEAVGEQLGLMKHSRCMSLGVRVNDYNQVRNAIQFLREHGSEIRYLPPELFPGMDYTAFAVDPDGHLVQIYSYMEQVGWDGRPRPAELRPKIDNDRWPGTLEPYSDSYCGESFLGPWA